MSDLISRSDVLKLPRYNFGVSMLTSEEYIKVSAIKEILTVYEIDKVVEELYMHSVEDEIPTCCKYRWIDVNEAIEIVKHGYVSDDMCEWCCDDYGRWHTDCHHLADNDPLEYTYCPYCGKKIKVVE